MPKDLDAAARLFDVVNCDDVVLDVLEGLVRASGESRRAKAELASLSAADLRAVLELRARVGR